MHAWMGNLFSRGVRPLDLEGMGFRQLMYWNAWHEEIVKAEKRAVQK